MNGQGGPVAALLAVLAAIGVGVVVALQPSPEVGFVLQMGGLGAAIGTVVTLWRRHRDPRADMSLYVVRWTVFGLGIGVAWALIDAVL